MLCVSIISAFQSSGTLFYPRTYWIRG